LVEADMEDVWLVVGMNRIRVISGVLAAIASQALGAVVGLQIGTGLLVALSP
jgi:hypothetical protein